MTKDQSEINHALVITTYEGNDDMLVPLSLKRVIIMFIQGKLQYMSIRRQKIRDSLTT